MEMAERLGTRLISHDGAASWRPGPGRFYVFPNHGTGLHALRPLYWDATRSKLSCFRRVL